MYIAKDGGGVIRLVMFKGDERLTYVKTIALKGLPHVNERDFYDNLATLRTTIIVVGTHGIARLTPNLDRVFWAVRVPDIVNLNSVYTTDNYIYVIADYGDKALIPKLDPSGDIIWSRSIGAKRTRY